MPRINKDMYLERKSKGTSGGDRRSYYRDWWLVKHQNQHRTGLITMSDIQIPKEFVGKRIRFKMEILPDKIKLLKKKMGIKRSNCIRK